MNVKLQQKLSLFTENAQEVKRAFTWHNPMTKRLAALLYALEDRRVNCDAIRDAQALMKSNTGTFSAFRGNMALCLAALLSLRPGRDRLFSDTLAVYDMLKNAKLYRSDFLAVAAYQIAVHGDPARHGQTVERTRAFYDGMKANHWFLTGQDDYIFAAMLALSDIDAADGIARIERIFSRLKPEFWTGNSVQTLAQVLVLGGNDGETPNRVLVLRDAFRSQGVKLDKMYTLPSLGVLALLPVDTETLVADIRDAQGLLRGQKGFGALSVDMQEILLFSASAVVSAYAENRQDNVLTASLATSIANIMLAQEAAMIAAISASAAAAAASSN